MGHHHQRSPTCTATTALVTSPISTARSHPPLFRFMCRSDHSPPTGALTLRTLGRRWPCR
eukprot:9625932-Alexandrium_andersonii.AAC.1